MGESYWVEDQQGNFSNDKNDTFDENKRYIGVRLKQGVLLLDRNWNELEDIRRYEEQMLRKHYIGNGTPDDGFKINACAPPESNFKIGIGRCLVDGFEVVNDIDRLYTDQNLADSEKKLSTPADVEERIDTVYLDVWINEVRSPETAEEEKDPERFDLSLKNKDDINEETSLRHKLVWRVRVDEGSKGEYKEKPLVKSTTIEFVNYEYKDDNWGTYPVVDLFTEKYVPLKPNDASKLAKLVLDSKDTRELGTTQPLDLGQGYSLHVQTDIDGRYLSVFLEKDGQLVSNYFPPDTGNQAWTLNPEDVQGEGDIPVMKVEIGDINKRAGSVSIYGIWLIDYANVKNLKIGDKIRDYKLTEIIPGVDESHRGSLIFEVNSESGKPNKYHHYYDIARIKRKKGKNEILDIDIEDLREERGKDKITAQNLTFKNDKVLSNAWPKLTCEAANHLDLSGDLIIKASGRVGIGTSSPSNELEVNGTVKASKFAGNEIELRGISYLGLLGISQHNPLGMLHISPYQSYATGKYMVPLILECNAEASDIKDLLKDVPNNTIVIGSVDTSKPVGDESSIQLYWKSSKGKIYFANIAGTQM